MKGRRGNPGIEGRLLDKSVDAYVLSLEVINRISVKYRVEAFAYLICNAWELLLKAKIVEDTRNRDSIYYSKRKGEPRRSLSLRDCLNRVFPNEQDPTRRNLERLSELRDEAVHLVIAKVPQDVLALFQACVLNYHTRLSDWFAMSLSDRVPVGMMTIVYDLSPGTFDLNNAKLRRELGRDAAEYLLSYQAAVRDEFNRLGRPVEFSIGIEYKLALIKRDENADIVLGQGQDGQATRVVEVPKDPGRTHPYRLKELVERVNGSLSDNAQINRQHVLPVITAYAVRKRPEFYYKSSIKNSPPQYSEAFADWLLREYGRDDMFFAKAKRKCKAPAKASGAAAPGGRPATANSETDVEQHIADFSRVADGVMGTLSRPASEKQGEGRP